MARKNYEAGLTVVEMLVTIALMGMIGAAVVGAAYVSQRSYNTSYNHTHETRQARLAMERIVRELRVAKAITINSATQTLIYQSYDDGATNRTISVGADNCLYLNNGTDTRALTRLAVTDFNCSFNSIDSNNATLDITITVSNTTSLTSAVRLLNI
jgi:type II secretory pathway component PulJ